MDYQEDKSIESSHDELSDIWQKLLGIHPTGKEANPDIILIPSCLTDDPWSQLLQAQGARVVDLQHMHSQERQISLSDLEVEQALQIMQEQPVHGKNQT
jgi:hypothetical protein